MKLTTLTVVPGPKAGQGWTPKSPKPTPLAVHCFPTQPPSKVIKISLQTERHGVIWLTFDDQEDLDNLKLTIQGPITISPLAYNSVLLHVDPSSAPTYQTPTFNPDQEASETPDPPQPQTPDQTIPTLVPGLGHLLLPRTPVDPQVLRVESTPLRYENRAKTFSEPKLTATEPRIGRRSFRLDVTTDRFNRLFEASTIDDLCLIWNAFVSDLERRGEKLDPNHRRFVDDLIENHRRIPVASPEPDEPVADHETQRMAPRPTTGFRLHRDPRKKLPEQGAVDE